AGRSTLLPQSESLDDALVALKVARAQIIEHAPALAHELEQASTGMMVALVRLEVLGQVADPIAQQRDLDLRRSGVRAVPSILRHDLSPALLQHCHPALSDCVLSRCFRLDAVT